MIIIPEGLKYFARFLGSIPMNKLVRNIPVNTITMKLLIRYKAIITCDLELRLKIIGCRNHNIYHNQIRCS
jgi:hypothetical protein